MEILAVSPNEAHVIANTPHVISDDEDIDSLGTNVESAVSSDNSIIKKKKNKDVNEPSAEILHPAAATT